MNDSISRQAVIDAIVAWTVQDRPDVEMPTDLIDRINALSSADVQPVTYFKDCRWLADIKDVETGELYHTCGVLAFDVPDGFACNQGKRKGADND